MPQTRFVLKKALEFGLAVVVVVNKIDRTSARPEFVVNSTFELFIELNASDEQVLANIQSRYKKSLKLCILYYSQSEAALGIKADTGIDDRHEEGYNGLEGKRGFNLNIKSFFSLFDVLNLEG